MASKSIPSFPNKTNEMTFNVSFSVENVDNDLRNYLQDHPLKFERFSLVYCRHNCEYYMLVNVTCNMVHAEGVTTYYSFTGINVYDDEISDDKCIKEEKRKHVLQRLSDHGYDNRLTYPTMNCFEDQESTERNENVTELDIELVGPPTIVTGTTWNEMFTATFNLEYDDEYFDLILAKKTFFDTLRDCFREEGLHFCSETLSVQSFYSKDVFKRMIYGIAVKCMDVLADTRTKDYLEYTMHTAFGKTHT